MHRAVLGFLCQALVNRNRSPPVLRLSSLACCLKSFDSQEPSRSSICSESKGQCIYPLIAITVRKSNWDEARKISFRQCVRLYGLSQSICLFALLMRSFLPQRIREIRCLMQSIVDYCGNAGPELFELAPMLVSNLGGSMTLLQVYATLIRIFVELSMFEDALLTYIEAKKVGVELQMCNFLLKHLVGRNQIMYARSLFDDMKSSGPSPNVYSYSVLMSIYTHGDRLCLEEAFELLCEMEMKGVRPNAVTYGTYLYGLCRARQVTSAWDFLQMLCERGYPCNSYCFNAVIHGFCHEGQVQKGIEVFDGMKKGGFVPDAHSYSILVDGLCKQGDLLIGYDVLVEMARNGIAPTLEAFRLYHKMVDEGTRPNIFTYTSLINGLCHDDRLPEVMTLFKHMIGEGLTPDRILYTSLIACYCKRSNMKAALEIFREMENGGLSADAFVYTCLIGGFSKALAMDGAHLLMEEMINKGLTPTVVTYTDLIIGYFKIGDEKKANMMYNSMLQAGITPDAKLSCILGFDTDRDDFEDFQEEKDVS